ncbi:MAG: hypothetical protein P8179_20475 [Candidatus Thiodiazotropha sp.]
MPESEKSTLGRELSKVIGFMYLRIDIVEVVCSDVRRTESESVQQLLTGLDIEMGTGTISGLIEEKA